jgi:hypothetical protein
MMIFEWQPIWLPLSCGILVDMLEYSSEDYAPLGSKILKREALIDKILLLTCAITDGRVIECGGEKGLVGAKTKFANAFVKSYFANVTNFKMNNDYTPQDKINQCKISALMLKTLKGFLWHDIFYRIGNFVPDNIMEDMHCEMAVQITRGILHIPTESVPDDMYRDFYICFSKQPYMSDEWACWSMANYMRAFGEPMEMED